jgi:hypothetical protein
VVEDICCLIESNTLNFHLGLPTRMSTTHDKQIERKIGDSAVPVDTSTITAPGISSWIPVVVASTGRVVHIPVCVTCSSWRENIFSNFPNIVARLARISVDDGTKDIAHRLVESWRKKRSKRQLRGISQVYSSGLWFYKLSRTFRAYLQIHLDIPNPKHSR